MMVSIVVVLPAPLRPTRTTDSPPVTRRDTPRSTWTWPRYVSMRSTSSMPGAPIRSLTRRGRSNERGSYRVVPTDLFRGSVREDRALVHDDDALGIAEHDVHVVLDDDDGYTSGAYDRADDIHDRCLLSRRHTARRLVEEEQLRPQRIGDRDIEQLALAMGDRACPHLHVPVKPEAPEYIVRLGPHVLVAARQRRELGDLALAREDRERDVVGAT